MSGDLPDIDEFDTTVEASASMVFQATATYLGRAFEGPGARTVGRILGCVNRGNTYTVPPLVGQEANGFVVTKVVEPKVLVLEGQHRFSTYRLSFLVDPLAPLRAQLHARTEAVFPGMLGALYRVLVIGSGAHEIVVSRMLEAIARRAERLDDAT